MLAILDPQLCISKVSHFSMMGLTFPWWVVRVKTVARKHLTHPKPRWSIRWNLDRIFLCWGSCTCFWTLIISRLIFLLGAKGTFFSNSSSSCTESEKSLFPCPGGLRSADRTGCSVHRCHAPNPITTFRTFWPSTEFHYTVARDQLSKIPLSAISWLTTSSDTKYVSNYFREGKGRHTQIGWKK